MATSQVPSPRSASAPSRVRYLVVVFAVTLAVVTYIARVPISVSAPAIAPALVMAAGQVERRHRSKPARVQMWT